MIGKLQVASRRCQAAKSMATARPCAKSKQLSIFGGQLRSRVALLLACFLMSLLFTAPASAHIGSNDVFEQVTSGPYRFFVTIRPPSVIPGVASVDVRVSGPAIDTLTASPVPLTGEASLHAPAPDPMRRSADDPSFFTGSLWLMGTGSWQVRLQAQGSGGAASISVPVPAVALSVRHMQRPLGALLALLGLLLVGGMAAIVAGAVREARLAPGREPTLARQYRARIAGGVTLAVLVLAVLAGDRWWNVEAAGYALDVYHPLGFHATLQGNVLHLKIDEGTPDDHGRRRSNDDLLPDHGHLMHLYAIHWPQMDAAYHLHPKPAGPGQLRMFLPSMLPGNYRLFADIVHRSGFPETLTTTLYVPPDASHFFLDSEDAAAYPPPLSAGMLGDRYKLPDGYTMVWERPNSLTANTAETFRFLLLDPNGNPARNMRPYLGMAGHAAFVKTDGSVFAHTHPEGSAAMPAMMLANAAGNSGSMAGMAGMEASSNPVTAKPLAPVVEFPYGFPSPGRYRVFVQMKHDDTVETGVFDAEVR